MKRILVWCLMVATIAPVTHLRGQFLKDIKKVKSVFKTNSGYSDQEAGDGIKEALINGITKGVAEVSQLDGYFGNPKIKIPIPPEAQKVETQLRNMGLGSEIDKAILSINRAAEDAAIEAKPIFVAAIRSLTFEDAINIVTGEQDAATKYLERTTTNPLTEKFEPIIEASLEKVNATKYWEDVISTYNKIPLVQDLNPDLTSYVTQKALEGLFHMIAKEELAIRQDPVARTSAILKKVFG